MSEREPNVKKEDTSLNEIKEEKETSTEKESSTAKSSGSKMQKDFTNHSRKWLRENSLEVLMGVDWFKSSKAGIFPSEGTLYIEGKCIRLDDIEKIEIEEEIALEVVEDDEFEESPDCLEFELYCLKG